MKNWIAAVTITSFAAPIFWSMPPNEPRAYAKAPANRQGYLIVPGKSVGLVKLGDSRETVHKNYGPAHGLFSDGASSDGMEGYSNGLTIRYRKNRVAEIEVRAKPYATVEGVSVGSSPRRSKGVFKGGIQRPYKVKWRKPPMTIYLYHDIKRGVAFWFGDNKSNSTSRCDSIVVHRSGGYMGGSMPAGK